MILLFLSKDVQGACTQLINLTSQILDYSRIYDTWHFFGLNLGISNFLQASCIERKVFSSVLEDFYAKNLILYLTSALFLFVKVAFLLTQFSVIKVACFRWRSLLHDSCAISSYKFPNLLWCSHAFPSVQFLEFSNLCNFSNLIYIT